jgi:hypothetical protein
MCSCCGAETNRFGVDCEPCFNALLEGRECRHNVAKCGPRTRAHSVGGGLTYSCCPQPKGHDGDHTV